MYIYEAQQKHKFGPRREVSEVSFSTDEEAASRSACSREVEGREWLINMDVNGDISDTS